MSFTIETYLRDDQEAMEVVDAYRNMLELENVKLIKVEKIDQKNKM